MSFARSGPLKGILAQIRPQPARETGGPTPGSAQRRVSGFPQGANAEPCPPDRYSELRRAGAWRRRPTMGRRYTLHRVVGQPNFTIGRDLGWLPGMLEDASTGESCLAARRPYEPPGFSTYEDGCLRELEKPAAMEGTGETDSVAEAEGFEPLVRARRDWPFETTLIDLRRLLVRGDSFPCQRDLEFESRSLRRSQRTSLPLRRCHPRHPVIPCR